MEKPQRRRYLISRSYQLRFFLELLGLVILATLASSAAVYILADRELAGRFIMAHQQVSDLRSLLLPVLLITTLVTFPLVAGLTAWITVRETHRVVGPIRRFQQNLQRMAEGNLEGTTRIREGDELQTLVDSFNVLNSNLAAASANLGGAVEKLRGAVRELEKEGCMSRENSQRLREGIDEVERSRSFIRR